MATRTITLRLKPRDQHDGIIERIDDIKFEHGVENWSDSNEKIVVDEDLFDALYKALQGFFQITRIRPEVFSATRE
jgi:hypothetical protein